MASEVTRRNRFIDAERDIRARAPLAYTADVFNAGQRRLKSTTGSGGAIAIFFIFVVIILVLVVAWYYGLINIGGGASSTAKSTVAAAAAAVGGKPNVLEKSNPVPLRGGELSLGQIGRAETHQTPDVQVIPSVGVGGSPSGDTPHRVHAQTQPRSSENSENNIDGEFSSTATSLFPDDLPEDLYRQTKTPIDLHQIRQTEIGLPPNTGVQLYSSVDSPAGSGRPYFYAVYTNGASDEIEVSASTTRSVVINIDNVKLSEFILIRAWWSD
jgi:hypothetical protein